MSINIVSKSIFFNFITNLVLVFLLIRFQFEITEGMFTTMLLISLFFWSVHAGSSSEKHEQHARLNGFIVGVGSISIVLLFLFLFASFSLNSMGTNAFLFAVWSSVGYAGGWFGSKLTKSMKFAKRKRA
ncbi:hypothetical protein bcgnr5390_15870 [Bacillus luti]|nr:hypothetical protein BC2903_45710 [Bacillus cereus]